MGAQASRNKQVYFQPLFGREREGGKDSHSRQWRLSMAVFLNRNKRPSAAPIEVAEASLREAASPGSSSLLNYTLKFTDVSPWLFAPKT